MVSVMAGNIEQSLDGGRQQRTILVSRSSGDDGRMRL